MTGRIVWRTLPGITLGLLLLAPLSAPADAYSVLSHEALIDAVWDSAVVPLLRRRFPNTTDAELRSAHAYAYGGSVIQDLGYYPLGSKFFSDLTHYARAGSFVLSLLREARTVDEYAFALGALSHYVADNIGHPEAVNLAVADMYPALRGKYGKRVTYEDDPRAHVVTEFCFDVVQITGAGYLPRTYHNFIGFRVPKKVLERAFESTYGLRLSDLFFWEGLSLAIYRTGSSEVVPALGADVWRDERKKLIRLDPQLVKPRFNYRLAAGNYQGPRGGRHRLPRPWTWHWKRRTQQADLFLATRLAVSLVEILPKIGPLRTLKFKAPPLRVQDLFVNSFDEVVARYEVDLAALPDGIPVLSQNNLDTGEPLAAGSYRLADKTYEHWLRELDRHNFLTLTTEVRRDILHYYANLEDDPIADKEREERKTLLAALNRLRAAGAATVAQPQP